MKIPFHSIVSNEKSAVSYIAALCVTNPFSIHVFKIFILVFDFHLVFFFRGMNVFVFTGILGFVKLLICVDKCLLSNLESFQLLFLKTFLLPHSLFWNSDCTYVDVLNIIPNIPLWPNFLVH